MFGANDHYDNINLDAEDTNYYNDKEKMKPEDYKYFFGEGVYDSNCIYGENHNNNGIRNSIKICNGCRNTIQNGLDELL